MISKRIRLDTQTYPVSDRYHDVESGQDASQVKRLLEKHKNVVGKWLNIPELLPHLRLRRLITSDKDRQRMLSLHDRGKRSKICTRLTKVLASRCSTVGASVYTEFLSCLLEEHEHLGHYYIAGLLLGVSTDRDIRDHDVMMSRWIREIMRRTEPLLQSCLSLKNLLPFLREMKLLTSSEFELLHEDSSKETSWKIQKLFVILNAKGPIAHYLFFRCLEQEKEHRGHEDIYKEICRQIDNKFHNGEVSTSITMHTTTEINNDELSLIAAICEPHTRTPCRLGLEGSLGGQHHISEMRELQQHRYHGRWDCFRQGINELTESDDINVTAVGMLHNAVASIMFGNTDLSLHLVDEVEKMCSTLYGNNNQIMMGRCLYIRSAVYRHHQDYDSARHYLDLSKQVLTHSEPGADTASLYYHEGTLWLDLLHQNGSTREKVQAEHSFRMAIEHAEHSNSGLPLIAWHSKVFLALLYLGSSHDSLSHESPSTDNLSLAESILKSLDEMKLPPRTLALYHIALSDIYRWKCDLTLAKHHVSLGLTKAEQGNFAFERRFATHRLQHLHVLNSS